jgi:uncharacterized protein (TIGR02246 family)
MRLGALLFIATALLPAQAAAQGSVRLASGGVAQDAREIADVRAAYIAAVNEHDATRLARLYAPDAIAILADGVVRRGRADVTEYFRNALSTDDGDVIVSPSRFVAGVNVASETGSFVEVAGSGGRRATGAYVTIYTRGADGRWRIAMDVRTRGRDATIVRW